MHVLRLLWALQSALLYLAVIELIPEIFEIGEDAGIQGVLKCSVNPFCPAGIVRCRVGGGAWWHR